MSLRGRLLLLLVGLSAAGLIVVGSVSYAALRSYLLTRVDQQAVDGVEQVGHQLAESRYPDDGPGGGGGGPPRQLPEGTYGALRDGRGKVVDDFVFSYGTASRPRPTVPAELPLTTSRNQPRLVNADARSGSSRFRLLAVPLSDGGSLVVGVPLTEVDSTLHRFELILLVVAGAVLLVLGAAALWLVRLGLSPLVRMGRTAEAIAAGNYAERVEPATERTEVGRLGLSLNAMLGQIERAFAERAASEDRLRRFLSDASHELRTPLASIRGYAERFRIGAARGAADREKAMARIESEAKRMGVLVEDLLTLARLDEERELDREPVDLATFAREAVDAARVASPSRPITLSAGGPLIVDGDPGRLRQVVDNLVRNALTHTPDGTVVDVRLESGDGRAHLEVRDHGQGLPTGDPSELFGRFWRTQAGRERGKGGAGLGLAIVAGIVGAHGGEVSASDAPGGGARFEVVLPLSKPPAGA